MAKGQTVGAHGSTRRMQLPRVGSLEGNKARAEKRASAMPTTTDKYRNGFTRAGSRNPRKVGRG